MSELCTKGPAASTGNQNGSGWAIHAEALADWALARLFVRRDVFGAYTADFKTFTAHEPVTRDLLVAHFKGERVIGAHTTNGDNLCLWAAFDIDAHDETADQDVNRRVVNVTVAGFECFRLTPLIIDSNGKGGFHVRVFFKKPQSAELVRWMLDRIVADLTVAKLPVPESFPKQAALTLSTPFGNWLRVPGRHHKRDHWTRILDPRTGQWFEGEAAAKRLLQVAGDDCAKLRNAFKAAHPTTGGKGRTGKASSGTSGTTASVAEVCSALDAIPNDLGVDYDAWIWVGMALAELGDDGLDLFHAWSKQNPKYDEAATARKYASFSAGNGPGTITLRSLFKQAYGNGWQGYKVHRNGNATSPTTATATAKPTPTIEPTATASPEPEPEPIHGGWDNQTPGRPTIRVTADYHVTVALATDTITQHPDVFIRGRDIAHVLRHPGSKPDDTGIKRAAGTPVIDIVDVASARVWMSRTARFEKFDVRKNDWLKIPPPKDVAASVIGFRQYPHGRELVGVVEAPTLRPDGSVLDVPGYDAATGLLYVPSATFPAIPTRPTQADAEQALARILKLVEDFPFQEKTDTAAWVAYLLSVVGRSTVAGPVPMFLFSANVAGAGKSYLSTLPSLIATGREPATDGYAVDDAEMEKRLLSMAIAGDRLIVFDNAENNSRIGCSQLDRAITCRGAYSGRILGSSKMADRSVPWSAIIAVTGNNISTRADSRRRAVACYLMSPEAKPEERDPEQFNVFKETGHDLRQHVLDNRPGLLVDALTIVRAYIVAGRPKMGLTSADFPEWSRVIRDAVAWSYDFDPMGSSDRLESEDETASNRVQLVIAWRLLCEAIDADTGETDPSRLAVDRGITTADAAARLRQWSDPRNIFRPHEDVVQAFAPFAPKGSITPDATRLGFCLRREKDAPTQYGTLRRGTVYRGSNIWFVDKWHCPSDQ
jgi:putative DNA primase/helicase